MERTESKLEDRVKLVETPQITSLDYAPVSVKESKQRNYLIAGIITAVSLAGVLVAYKLLNDYVNSVNESINSAIGRSFAF